MTFKAIITIILFAGIIQAQEDESIENLTDHEHEGVQEENFQEQLINDLKAQHNLSFFSNPMLSIYASSCDEQSASSTQHSLEQICNVVVHSEECKDVEPKEDLLNCSHPAESASFDPVDFIVGCGKGLWNTVVELFDFLWTIIRNASDIPEEFMEYAESAKLYLVNEYDKAYEEAESFKALSAVKAVASDLAKKVYHAMQQMVQKEYKEFGCLNFEARTKKVCTLLGAFVDPFVFLKVLKLGRNIYRVMNPSEKAEKKVLRKARKHLKITKKDVKVKKAENNKLLSQYSQSGDIQNGVVQAQYITREGVSEQDWIQSVDSKYIQTEKGKKVPRDQIVSVHRSESAVKGVEEHQRIFSWLKGGKSPDRIQVSTEKLKMVNVQQVHSDGVLAGGNHLQYHKSMLRFEDVPDQFIHRRDIDFVSRKNKVRDPLPVSSDMDPNLSQFRESFNEKKFNDQAFTILNYDHRGRYISLDYNGEKRQGLLRKQIEDKNSQMLEIDLIPRLDDATGFESITLPFSDRGTLESIRVSENAHQKIRHGRKYAGIEDIPMQTSGLQDEAYNAFRTAYNTSETITDDIRYVEFEGELFEITSIYRGRGEVHARSLETERNTKIWIADPKAPFPGSNDDHIIFFSHYLDKLKANKNGGEEYIRETKRRVKKAEDNRNQRDYL